jgi:ERCC4-type nuclease
MNQPTIYIDRGEVRSGLPTLIRGLSCNVIVDRLTEGDYLVSAAFAIERKTPSDLVNSLLNGRLLDQLDRLSQAYEYAALLIEGDSWGANPRLKSPMLARLYQWISLRPYLTTLYSPDIRMTARLLAGIARAEQDERQALPPFPAPPTRPRPRGPRDVLCGLPSIGQANADRLLARFNTIARIAQATQAELCETVGPKRGSTLHAILHQQTGPRRSES